MESFFGNLQLELLDQRTWATRRELASAIFEWIQAWYNPARRHPALGYHSPISYERIRQMLPNAAACSAQPTRPGHRGKLTSASSSSSPRPTSPARGDPRHGQGVEARGRAGLGREARPRHQRVAPRLAMVSSAARAAGAPPGARTAARSGAYADQPVIPPEYDRWARSGLSRIRPQRPGAGDGPGHRFRCGRAEIRPARAARAEPVTGAIRSGPCMAPGEPHRIWESATARLLTRRISFLSGSLHASSRPARAPSAHPFYLPPAGRWTCAPIAAAVVRRRGGGGDRFGAGAVGGGSCGGSCCCRTRRRG